jgi:tetraacyldisaccharide 4'-kinase
MALRTHLYRSGVKKSFSTGIPVVSVGNITVGGTGKTPMSMYLLKYLAGKGVKVAYLSRGYGRYTKGYQKVMAESTSRVVGDEALMISKAFPNVPVSVCADRVGGAKRLIQDDKVGFLLLDDAFQHMRIRRDFDILMIDMTRPPWEDHPFPSGYLREFASGAGRADFLVVAKFLDGQSPTDIKHLVSRHFPGKPICVMEFKQVGWVNAHTGEEMPADAWVGKECVAFSGLGHNDFFKSQLEASGIVLGGFVSFPDHHQYHVSDWSKILEMARKQTEINGKFGPSAVLTTEKDFQRLRSQEWFSPTHGLQVLYLKIELRPVWGWEGLQSKIDSLIKL